MVLAHFVVVFDYLDTSYISKYFEGQNLLRNV